MQSKVKSFLLILLVIGYSLVLSQELSENWKLIKSDDISRIYIDPSKIVEYGNEISVWAIEKIEKPKNLEKGKKIYSIKTHYLFNKMKKKYAEIGVIYYGSKGGIVNRSSKSSFNGGSTAFMTPISASPNVEIVYKEVISYLITGNVTEVDKNLGGSTIKPIVVNNKKVVNEKEGLPKEIAVEDKNISIEVASDSDIKSEPPVKTKKLEENLKMDISSIPKSEVSVKEIKKVELPKLHEIEIAKNEYNLDNERAIKNALFTDGYLYCFQVSSWKTKSYADREVNKLIAKGYNAFLVSVKPRHKKSIWHRVRVGYFNSLQEAKKTQRKVR